MDEQKGISLQDYGTTESTASVPVDGASRLLRIADLAQGLGTEPVADEARELARRISEPISFRIVRSNFAAGGIARACSPIRWTRAARAYIQDRDLM
jgi:hypothetical protein